MSRRTLQYAELFIIIVLACIPLLVTLPYRVNIFLSWEGAYRISRGQLPFRDFGTPLGGIYWLIPAIFFKIFGPQMITLVKAQVFINIIAGLSFRSILNSLSVRSGIRVLSVLVFCISYSFFNFWPWYNHSVIVYELVALAFLFKFLLPADNKYRLAWLAVSAFFVCFSFLTKQDGGGMTFLICCALLAGYGLTEKKWIPLVSFTGFFAVILFLLILPFLKYGFGYWFNHGQPPHTARVSAFEITDEFFSSSQWIKFYLFLIVILLLSRFQNWKSLYSNKRDLLFLLLTLAILGEAAVFQVTSYTPPDNNIFFHSFAFVFLFSFLAHTWPVNFEKPAVLITCIAGIMLWWSSSYWKYIQRIAMRVLPQQEETVSATGENVVNRRTYILNTDTANDASMNDWVETGLKSFKHIYMPKPTADGMNRLLNMDLVRQHKNLRVLNMSELTPLAEEIPYQLESNPQLPLWYHLGVGMFNRQAEIFEKRIGEHYYDLVLFEYVPSLNNFYPFRVRDSLRQHYKMVDSFAAPRRGETKGSIEVYVK